MFGEELESGNFAVLCASNTQSTSRAENHAGKCAPLMLPEGPKFGERGRGHGCDGPEGGGGLLAEKGSDKMSGIFTQHWTQMGCGGRPTQWLSPW